MVVGAPGTLREIVRVAGVRERQEQIELMSAERVKGERHVGFGSMCARTFCCCCGWASRFSWQPW